MLTNEVHPRPAEAPGVATRPVPLDLAAIRHPIEASRFALAIAAATLMVSVLLFAFVSISTNAEVVLAVLGVLAFFALLWLLLQLWRVRLLADGVKVDQYSLPELQEVTDIVRSRLGFEQRVDVFVVDKMARLIARETRSVSITGFFGVRVIVLESGVLGDLSDERDRQRLTFLLASYYGALKARHTQWATVLEILWGTGVLRPVFLLVAPWFRATVYTGDRLAYACCGDLDVSIQTVYHALVGKEVAPHLRSTGLVNQALRVRRSLILRLAQLLRVTPHVSNRYLELLAYAEATQPAPFHGFRSTLQTPAQALENVLATLHRRRSHPAAVPAAAVACVAMLLTSIAAAAATRPSAPSPTPEPVSAAEALLAEVPSLVRNSCTAVAADTATYPGLVAQLDCSTSDGPDALQYQAYRNTSSMTGTLEGLLSGVSGGDCSTGLSGRQSWVLGDGSEPGQLACAPTQDGGAQILWSDDERAVITWASDPSMTVMSLYAWWVDFPHLPGD